MSGVECFVSSCKDTPIRLWDVNGDVLCVYKSMIWSCLIVRLQQCGGVDECDKCWSECEWGESVWGLQGVMVVVCVEV